MGLKHELVSSGAAFAAPDCMEGDCLVFDRDRVSPAGSVRGEGHAVCACGERSPHLLTYRARVAWKAEHVADRTAVA